MKISLKIILSQIISLVSAYFVASWIGNYSDVGLFDIGSSAFVAFALFPFIYLFFITLFSNVWFSKINKWNYLTPAFFVLLLMGFLGYGTSNIWFVIKEWLLAFLSGWILAWIVNFFASLIKK